MLKINIKSDPLLKGDKGVSKYTTLGIYLLADQARKNKQ